jgi:probable rRNA maturation factor
MTAARFNVVIANRQRTKKINGRLLKQLAHALFAETGVARAELGVNLVRAAEMARVNQAFLNHEGSTDVITFDYLPPEPRTQASDRELHGELFICVDDAVAQAKEFKTSWQSELVRYLVHGVLHLLGHDDLQAGPRRKMKRAENRLLRRLARQLPLAAAGKPFPLARPAR